MKTIAYQGVQGAYSEQACKSAYPHHNPIACKTFQEAMLLVEKGDVDLAMIPLENSTAGRVEEIYRLIPKMLLHVIAEHYEPVVHCLLGVKDAKLEDLVCVGSHPQALAQCYDNIASLDLQAIAKLDTAGAAKDLMSYHDKSKGAIASKLAAEIYGLQVLKENFEDISGNVTRFFVLSKRKEIPIYSDQEAYVTSLLFQVRDIPAALYKVLGGFATNGVNLLKIESYSLSGTLQASQFHIDLQGHPEEKELKHSLEELAFFAEDVRMLGTYKADRFRKQFES